VSGIAIVDSGGANISSLIYALRRLGAEATLTRDPALVAAAERVLLPGVGAAADAMRRLRDTGMAELLPRLTQPVLGICLGMQLLFDHSEEGDTPCLGILPGTASPFEPAPDRPVPHMGWNRAIPAVDDPLFEGLEEGAWFYFVHSYALPEGPVTTAVTDYGGPFTAAAARGNFHGTQFHPERSSAAGARVLRNFLAL
jgi:glutamine amidotransferase